jgi:mono/diheme cytochrome c family protein
MVSIFGRSMRDQASFDPYEYPLNAPEGSVPFAAGNLEARPGEVNVGQPEGLAQAPAPFTQLDVLNEAEVVVGLANPVPATEASIARGEELFLRFCAPCHGPDGNGVSGYIIPAGFPPYPLMTDRVQGFTDGYIYGMIRAGRGLMPAYGHRISHFDRWNVVNYLRVLQGVVPTPVQPGSTAEDADVDPQSDPMEGASSLQDGAHSP